MPVHLSSDEAALREEAEETIASRPPANSEDQPPEPPQSPAAREGEEGEPEASADGRPPYHDDPREALYERHRERRKQLRESGEEGDGITPTISAIAGQKPDAPPVDTDTRVPPDSPPARASKASAGGQPPPADDPIVEQVVNGTPVRLPQSEWMAMARKNLAADSYLEMARSIYGTAAQSGRDADTRRAPSDQDEDEAGEPHPGKPPNLIDVVDAIQTSSPEEAAELLASYQRTTQITPDAVTAVVDQELRRQDDTRSINRALHALRVNHPELSQDRHLQTAVVDRTVEELVGAMRDIGVPDHELAQVAHDPKAVLRAYVGLRHDPTWGPQMRDFDQVTERAATFIGQRYMPQNARYQGNGGQQPGRRAGRIEISPEREGRKAGLERQPRSANIRAGGGPPEMSVADKRRAVIMERINQQGQR